MQASCEDYAYKKVVVRLNEIVLAPWKKSYDQPRQHIKKQRHYFANKGQNYGFSSSHMWMWELDHKESWVPKNWCFWIVVLEKTLESPLDCKETKLVHPEGNQSWIFIGRTDGEAEAPIHWPSDAKSWLIWKDPDAGKNWRGEEKRTTEDEMVGWNHWLDGYEFEQALGVGDGQRSLVFCSPWGRKESDTTEQLNWTELSLCEAVVWGGCSQASLPNSLWWYHLGTHRINRDECIYTMENGKALKSNPFWGNLVNWHTYKISQPSKCFSLIWCLTEIFWS